MYIYIYIYSVLNLCCRNFMVFSGFKTIFLNLAFSLSDLAINIDTTQYSKSKRILMSILDICDKFRTIWWPTCCVLYIDIDYLYMKTSANTRHSWANIHIYFAREVWGGSKLELRVLHKWTHESKTRWCTWLIKSTKTNYCIENVN